MAAITRLSVDGYGARRAGSFAGKEGTVVSVPVVVENSGGWPIYEPRRKKKEQEREELVTGHEIILEDIPTQEQQKPKRKRQLRIEPHVLSQSEIDQILETVQGEIDQEIAIYLRAIEKRRRRNLALVLLLDAT